MSWAKKLVLALFEPPGTILKTDKPMNIEEVRKYLVPHLGRYVFITNDYGSGIATAMGYLTRFGDNIGLESEGGGCGVLPEKMDEQIAGLFAYEDLGNGSNRKTPVPNYIVVHRSWMGKRKRSGY